MALNLDEVLAFCQLLFRPEEQPRWGVLLRAVARVRAGERCEDVAREVRTRQLNDLIQARDPLLAVLKPNPERYPSEVTSRRVKASLGQLLIGRLAERAFEAIYRQEVQTTELRLEDDRASRSDTDYRILNGSGRPVFRMNIKFHGSLFRNARELVGLDPSDCFALATYKVHHAIAKQEQEHLPYIFVIIGVPNLTGEKAGEAVPADLLNFATLLQASDVPGKRDIEDRIVNHLTEDDQPAAVKSRLSEFAGQIASAEWRVLSARKADHLVREKLFERVYAVRVRAFARNYPNAELDMHFSISTELTPLREFLRLYREAGLHGLVGRLERGTI